MPIGAILTKYWMPERGIPILAPVETTAIQEKQAMTQNREGQRVPNVTFRIRENNDWKSVTTEQLFAGKTVAVFSLPGAFTPTCSSTHVPGYNDLCSVLKDNGVDDIICISV